MVRLRTLGTLDLISEGQPAELRHLLQQSKRMGLLVYLRLNASKGPVMRDSLLGIFWPELSQERGRRALSQALYVLRQSLGNGLLKAVGQDLVGVDTGGIGCDASAFEEALAEGRPEEALELYRGDLLEGFFLSDAPEFERWLEEQRTRLKNLAADAARGLVDREEAQGNLHGAARWARRTSQLLPYDQRAAVRLIELFLQAGDRSGARHEFRRYRDCLRVDLEIEPPPELEHALFAERPPPPPAPIIASESASASASLPVHTPADIGSQPIRRGRVRSWRTPAIVLTVLVASVLLSTAVANQSGRRQRGGRPSLLVAPITNRTGNSDLNALARLAGDWLGTEIARTGRATVIPPVYSQQILSEISASGDTSSLAALVAAAARTDASLVIGGNLFGTAEFPSLDVFGLDPRTGEVVFAPQPFPVTPGAPQQALEQLREATLVALSLELDDRMGDWITRASQPPTVESYRNYSAALDLFLTGTWPAQAEATELFIEAWRSDTTFTAPLILALLGMMNTNQGDRADSVVHVLEPEAASLAEWDRAMLSYVAAWLHGDLLAQYRSALEIVTLVPNSEWRILLARAAAAVGCHDEALSVLTAMNSRSGSLDRSAFGYWALRIDLQHLRGDTAGELRDATAALAQLSDERYHYRSLAAEIRVAAIAGDFPRLERHLGEVRAMGRAAHNVYLKLFYWGPFDIAPDRPEYQVILDSARAWYQDRPEEAKDRCWYKNARFNLLYHSRNWLEAEQALDSLAAAGCMEFPEYGTYRAPLAAHLGDLDRARAIADSFPWSSHMGEIQLGSQFFWKARVEAIAGEAASAVTYLRAANRRGVPYGALHENSARIDFASMWDYEPLQQLLANRRCSGG